MSKQNSRPRASMVYGFWGQNIGNAFFNIGGKWILEQVFGQGRVAEIQDQPGYRTFHKKHKGNPRNDLQLLQYIDSEFLVLQGPMLTSSFEALWRPTFEQLKQRGTKIVLLSAAFFQYSDEEVRAVRKFLTEFPPAMISTRDADSYERIKDLTQFHYCGIDSAFFAPKAYTPIPLNLPPYVVVNFDQYPEPEFKVATDRVTLNGHGEVTFEALGMTWSAKQPWLQRKFSEAGQWQCYLGSLLDFRRLPQRIGDYLIVRTDHRFNPHITWKVYSQPNAVASDEPFTYFTLYAGAELTLSDRVHACVATLAFGNPAMLYHPTPRARLFERLDLNEIRQGPMSLPASRLNDEREAELDFLRMAVERLSS